MKMIVATDQSPHAQVAVELAGRLAQPDDEITVLSIGHVPMLVSPGAAAWVLPEMDLGWHEAKTSAALAAATAHAQAAAEQLRASRAGRVEACAQSGHLAEEILHVASERAADLVLLGSRGLGDIAGWLLGSVSHAVVAGAACSVCVARPPVEGAFHDTLRLLLAIDGSVDAEAALAMLKRLKLGDRATVSVVHVLGEMLPVEAQAEHEFTRVLEDRYRQHARDLVERSAAALRPDYVVTTTLVREGDPAHEIIEAARTGKIDLLVLGTRGLSGLRRLLMGSVAQKVAAHAPCSVLVVKQPQTGA